MARRWLGAWAGGWAGRGRRRCFRDVADHSQLRLLVACLAPADAHRVVAERYVVRHGDLLRHVAVRVGPEEIGLKLAEELDLTDLVGGHVRRRDSDPAPLYGAIGVDVERRRVGGD